MPIKRRIPAAPSPSPARKVIQSSEPKAPPLAQDQPKAETDETVGVALDVEPSEAQPTDVPAVEVPDPLEAVDYFGTPIKLGMYVDIYTAKVVGFRADADNHLNVLIQPFARFINTSDPNNPLNGQEDGKALLVSGYNCLAYDAADIANGDRNALLDELKTKVQQRDANPPDPLTLPSNFLAPSFV